MVCAALLPARCISMQTSAINPVGSASWLLLLRGVLDKDKCPMLCWMGAVTGHWRAGVATAFASPIGGLLFTIEEGASFYSTSIFWRGFLSTGIGVLTLHFLVECSVRRPVQGSQ